MPSTHGPSLQPPHPFRPGFRWARGAAGIIESSNFPPFRLASYQSGTVEFSREPAVERICFHIYVYQSDVGEQGACVPAGVNVPVEGKTGRYTGKM